MPSEPSIAEGTKAALLSVGMTPERAEAGVSAVARSMLASLNEVTDRLVEEIKTENPDYLTDMVSEDDLRLSCCANIERVLQLLGQCVDGLPQPLGAPPVGQQLLRRLGGEAGDEALLGRHDDGAYGTARNTRGQTRCVARDATQGPDPLVARNTGV